MSTADSIPYLDDEPGYYTYRPRPDQPARFDQQESFYNSRLPGVAFLIGGNGAGTSETALAKVAKFVLSDQPPPRKDTPFWIIAGSYEQACETCWNEKLFQHGHIPEAEIDRERIQWYKPNRNWPFAVPLKPWPVEHGGHPNKNWILEFKSYEQGRSQMQARSVGGFLFVEQFPWGLLEEVLRGCREYNFLGSKLAEFTPVDPNLSRELDDMIDEDRLPEGWAIFRANTECAMEAGHVSKTWFDEFFGMVPEQMRLTRMTGARPQYEGAIYPNFDPLIHATGPDVDLSDFPPNVHFRRGIDWGGGPNNAFVCLWAYKNGLGQWFVFDEYYSTAQDRTTIDHLCEVADRWPWPVGNPHYGTTWADPSSPDNLRIAQKLSMYTEGKYEGLSMGAAYNRVREGIEHVQWLLKDEPSSGKPRLLIDKKSCPNLVREMRTYRYLRASGTGLNPADARGEPLKKDDHAVDALRYLVASEANMTGLMTESFRRSDRKRERGIHLVGGKL